MLLFSIYNKQIGIFNPPFVARDFPDAEEVVRKAIITGRDLSLLVELENLELCLVGSFDAKDAELVNDVKHIFALSDIPLPDHVQQLVDRLKKVDADVETNGIKSFFYKLLEKVDKKQKKEVKKKEEEENCSSQ